MVDILVFLSTYAFYALKKLKRPFSSLVFVVCSSPAAARFFGGEHGIPERDEREGDELASAGTAAPVVDDPIVVDL